ncbi:MAG: pyridoxamine 5'-phosphate oxidase family protein [Deltaproteobacteria bacterium]|nr:pyridoxamine 5'-phosphate oxidase family protein [Deltaproteobacteria bacterium]
MGKKQLSSLEIEELLLAGEEGSLATVGPEGPYVVAVNYLYWREKIYFHGRKYGQKMKNIAADKRVSFLVYKTNGYRRGLAPCATTALYQSVLVMGEAKVLEPELAAEVLSLLGRKYSPDLADYAIPLEKLAITAVVEICPLKITGKAYEIS